MKYYIVDAFTDQPFGGNPAGVVILGEGNDFPEDEVMPLFRDSSDEEKEIVRKRFGYI